MKIETYYHHYSLFYFIIFIKLSIKSDWDGARIIKEPNHTLIIKVTPYESSLHSKSLLINLESSNSFIQFVLLIELKSGIGIVTYFNFQNNALINYSSPHQYISTPHQDLDIQQSPKY